MTNNTNPDVDFYFNKPRKWHDEIEKLRTIVLDFGLSEELKWGVPCYTFENSNILLIHIFKEYCAILFFKGALLKDTNAILIQQTENTQSARQIRFTSVQQIVEMETVLKDYINEAIEIDKSGIKVDFKKNTEITIPEELQNKLSKNAEFKTAFEALTPGRQKAYILYFSEPKQAKTRETRIEKYIPQILNGKGLKDCTCGLSSRMPNCDGSHKQIR